MRLIVLTSIVTVALAACGSLGRDSPGKPSAATSESESARSFGVAWTSAQASKCGFSFDPAKLRADFLASEAKSGATPDGLRKSEQAYDFTLARTGKTLSGAPGYCSKERIDSIRGDLKRHLAGDFAPGPSRAGDKAE